jgi:hypothetical protein
MLGSLYHYCSAIISVLLLFDCPVYLITLKPLRTVFLAIAYLTLIVYSITAAYEFYMIFNEVDWLLVLVSMYVGYIIIVNITLLPQTMFIIIKESTLDLNANEEFVIVG